MPAFDAMMITCSAILDTGVPIYIERERERVYNVILLLSAQIEQIIISIRRKMNIIYLCSWFPSQSEIIFDKSCGRHTKMYRSEKEKRTLPKLLP